ncbi:MAG: peptidase S8 [Balneola sp.]|nr:MAG: peptidase S8 [Balneola sp.]
MYSHYRFIFIFLFIVTLACSSSREATNTASLEALLYEAAESIELTATEDWHLTGTDRIPYYGTGVERAYTELLKEKSPKQEVIVAIIDSGTDVEHEDLAENVWVNEDEIPGNGIDDDGNGYIDDIHGWNFIGGPDGRSVDEDTYEVTRLYTKLSDIYAGIDPEKLSAEEKEEYEYYQKIVAEYEYEKLDVQQNLTQLKNIEQAVMGAKQILGVSSMDSLTADQIEPKVTDGPYLTQAKQLATVLRENDITENDLKEAVEQFQGLNDYGMNPDFDPRDIVGDDYEDLTNRFYGNNDVKGASYEHGTHVAGIVGAVRNNEVGINGVADVKLMILRAVPNGDERDKDVANAIRYAVENGAKVINMSFGKGYSPQKFYVDEAVKFADEQGVLLVNGAGNDSENIDSTDSYPNKYYESGGYATSFITVGASSWERGADLTAVFSNYGVENVDIFAPGVEVYSTYPYDEYKANDGTSMASPVVAGVAALVMSYYPELTAAQVKEIIMNTSTKPKNGEVYLPGTEQLVPFSTLSVSGGIVNAYEALIKAEEITSGTN